MKKNLRVTSEDVMNLLGINEPTLAQYILNKEIPVHRLSKETPIRPADLRGKVRIGPRGWTWVADSTQETTLGYVMRQLPNFVFSREDVLEFEAKQGLGVDEERKALLPCKPGTKWEQVTMVLVPSENEGEEPQVRIKTPDGYMLYSYQLPEMHHRQKPSKPKVIWTLLKTFAEYGGFISGGQYSSRLSDHKKLLEKHLQKIFGINESI